MASLEIPVRLVGLPYIKQMITDFTGLIEAVVSKDVDQSLEIAEGLAGKYGEKGKKQCDTCHNYHACNKGSTLSEIACADHVPSSFKANRPKVTVSVNGHPL